MWKEKYKKNKEDMPTEKTIMAMEETINDIKNGNTQVFYDMNEFMNDVNTQVRSLKTVKFVKE